MNIAIFTDTFLPKFNGIVTSALNTATELKRRGHRVRIIAPRISKDQGRIIKNNAPGMDVDLIRGVNAVFYPGFRWTFPAAPWIVSSLTKMDADIIHFHTPFTLGMEAIFSSAVLKLPLVSTFHTYFTEPEYLKIVHLHRIPGLSRFGWAYSNFFHNLCDVTVSPSRFTADELKRQWLRCPIRVISNGIQHKNPQVLSEEQKKKIRQKYGLKDKVMLFIGRVSVEKCIPDLLRAARRVFQKRNDTTLFIVGHGPAFDYIKRMARDMGIADNVKLGGTIPHEELIQSGIFEVSRFFATASTSENQPMTVIEACMFGLPIIGVNARGIPEMISGNGFVAKPGNDGEIAACMMKLLENDDLQREMSRASREMGKLYDIRRTTDQMEELYEVVVHKVKRQGKKRISLRTLNKIFLPRRRRKAEIF